MKKIVLFLITQLIFATNNEKGLIPVSSKNNNHINTENKITYIYNLKNKDSQDIIKALDIYENLNIKPYENKIIIYGNKSKINELINVLDKLDTPKEQVYMKVKILDISKDLIYRLGINWSKDSNISLIEYLRKEQNNRLAKFKKNGEIKLKIMPSILVLDNSKGELKISDLKIVLNPKIKHKYYKKYIELNAEIYFNDNLIKTTVNIDNGMSIFIGGSKNYENSTFSYKSNDKKIRDVYIEVEVRII
ncbi:hypothetical protein [Oceanivirga salmonicida]|uniref:hypothetical protein n=1 Tax=Oceanivirga salmonicida TaxID=1769291 RepID=UPI000831F35C|nr:hypothetical protein [Oceanivirga salmonicida]